MTQAGRRSDRPQNRRSPGSALPRGRSLFIAAPAAVMFTEVTYTEVTYIELTYIELTYIEVTYGARQIRHSSGSVTSVVEQYSLIVLPKTGQTTTFVKGSGTIDDNACTILVNRSRNRSHAPDGREDGRVERSCVRGQSYCQERDGKHLEHECRLEIEVAANSSSPRVAALVRFFSFVTVF